MKKADFGEIDGYGDPNLEKYFLDSDFWDKIIESNIFYVVGKKGTGKSSIYRMTETEAIRRGCVVVNKDFGEFPFEKLLKLEDSDFAKPNQYQTIWKNIILNLFIRYVADIPESNNIYHEKIESYRQLFLGDAEDIHKDIVTKTVKRETGLKIRGLESCDSNETSSVIRISDDNVTQINSRLEDLLINYFITTESDRRVIIQFDRLDDNYNQYQNLEEYYQAIISLFKVVYSFNQRLRSKHITNAKIVLYIRSDIMKAMASRDAESARWDDFRIDLTWNVNNMKMIRQSDLYKMVERRIRVSNEDLKNKTVDDVLGFIETNNGRRQSLFSNLVLQTLFRPRDLINLLKILQKEIVKRGVYNDSVYNIAIKRYSNWLVNTELANEINPILGKDYKYVIELLRLCSERDLNLKIFTEKYNALKHEFAMKPLELLEFLYGVGMIENTWYNTTIRRHMHRSIFRNEGEFDKNLNFRVLPAVWNGLTV